MQRPRVTSADHSIREACSLHLFSSVVPGHGKKFISSILFRLGHNVLDWTAFPWNFLLIFETFLGGALWHNVYRVYIVFWGTIIYCSLASVDIFNICVTLVAYRSTIFSCRTLHVSKIARG